MLMFHLISPDSFGVSAFLTLETFNKVIKTPVAYIYNQFVKKPDNNEEMGKRTALTDRETRASMHWNMGWLSCVCKFKIKVMFQC